jgi:dynein heavy chain
MNESIEKLINALAAERVPEKWISEGFSTTRKLGSWTVSLELRIAQYKIFENDSIIPKIVFINRLFNPLSYLTAIRQVYAQKNNAELDKLNILTDPTNIDLRNGVENLNLPKDGIPIYGMHLQGARWDEENRFIEESKPREDYCVMPVINCRVADTSAMKLEENKQIYLCPVYKTTQRDSTYVFTAQFRTKQLPAKWIIAGVAVILDVEKTDSLQKYPK